MLSSMESLRQVPKPDTSCTNAGGWIWNGSPIHLDYSDTKTPCWQEYRRAVTELLNEFTDSELLDEPIDHYWTESLGKPPKSTGQEWMATVKQKWKNIIIAMAVTSADIFSEIFSWAKDLCKSLITTSQDWMKMLKQKWNNMITVAATFGAILFWILHIAAALGLPLVANDKGYQTDPSYSSKTLL